MLRQKKKPEIVVVDDTKPNERSIPKPRTYKPGPTPRKSVNQMVQDYENNIILPPLEFRDRPVPTPIKN